MADDQSLPGGKEQMLRAIERVIAAASSKSQNSVRITNLASGKIQVEVHAVGDDLAETGDRARAEFERQSGLASVPADELERLRWWASVAMAADQRAHTENPTPSYTPVEGLEPSGNWDMHMPPSDPSAGLAAALADRDAFLAAQFEKAEVEGEELPDFEKIATVAAPAPGPEVSDA